MQRTLLGLVLLALACSSANASLVSRSGGLASYDTATNLTWVADANLAQTSGYCGTASNCFDEGPFPSGTYQPGLMTWTQAQAWIASLNGQNAGLGYLGTNDWRLPTVRDTGRPGCQDSYTGTDCGYNVDLSSGEMARMYYSMLGNSAIYNTSGGSSVCGSVVQTNCLTNTGPFSNLQRGVYWYGTEYALLDSLAWVFAFSAGGQNIDYKTSKFHAWAVRLGDIGVVPVSPPSGSSAPPSA